MKTKLKIRNDENQQTQNIPINFLEHTRILDGIPINNQIKVDERPYKGKHIQKIIS